MLVTYNRIPQRPVTVWKDSDSHGEERMTTKPAVPSGPMLASYRVLAGIRPAAEPSG
jgi:hypothetical protein